LITGRQVTVVRLSRKETVWQLQHCAIKSTSRLIHFPALGYDDNRTFQFHCKFSIPGPSDIYPSVHAFCVTRGDPFVQSHQCAIISQTVEGVEDHGYRAYLASQLFLGVFQFVLLNCSISVRSDRCPFAVFFPGRQPSFSDQQCRTSLIACAAWLRCVPSIRPRIRYL
jgi:hypothetical protein